MGGGAFIRLKTGQKRPESAKQAEIGLANLHKILWIGLRGDENRRAKPGRTFRSCMGGLPPDMANSWGISRYCKLDHNVCWETGAVCCKAIQGKVEPSIGFSFNTMIYAKSAVDRCFGRDVLTKISANTSNLRYGGRKDSDGDPPECDLYKLEMVSHCSEQ
jgi:hypothetical protein